MSSLSGAAGRWSARLASLVTRLRALPIDLLLRVVIAVVAAWFVIVYLVLSVVHMGYPFELEWLEGSMVDQVARVLDGEAIYVAPSADFVAYLYAPLYFYVSAAVAAIVGEGFFALRLVSVAASIGSMALIGLLVHFETKSRFTSFVAVAFYAATYPLSAYFMDIGRVDSLFVLLLLASLFVLRTRKSRRSAVISALLMTLAFLTKQSAPVVFTCVSMHLLFSDRRRLVPFFVTGAAAMLGSVVVLDFLHDGWFRYFVFEVPSHHPWVSSMAYEFWRGDVLRPLGVAVFLSLLFLVGERRKKARSFYLFAAAGLFGTAFAGRLHQGGWPNVCMPAYAAIALLFGLGLHAAKSLARNRGGRFESMTLIAALLQLATLLYDPRPRVPSEADAAAGYALVERLRAVEGDVLVTSHGYLAKMAGKRSFVHVMAAEDILSGRGDSAQKDALRKDIARAIEARQFAAIVTDGDWFRTEIVARYVKESAPPVADRNAFFPVLGFRTRPKEVFVLPRGAPLAKGPVSAAPLVRAAAPLRVTANPR